MIPQVYINVQSRQKSLFLKLLMFSLYVTLRSLKAMLHEGIGRKNT